MSSRSLVGVSIGSCAVLSENIGELGYVRVAFDAFNVESQFVGSRAELLKPVETPQVQFLAKVMQHTIFELCLPSECGLGMSIDFVDPVLSGQYSGRCVHCSSCGTLRDVVQSPLVGSTIVAGVWRRGVEWWLEFHS